MRLHLIVAIVLGLLCHAAFTAASTADLEAISRHIAADQYQQALEKQLTYHVESKNDPALAGVRLSFALQQWLDLGERYPPALLAMQEVRDADGELLMAGKGSFQNFMDFAAINQALAMESETYEVFLYLDKNYPEQAESNFPVVEELLIQKKDYVLCSKYLRDPLYRYEMFRYARETQLSILRNNPVMADSPLGKYSDQRFVSGVVNLIEVLVATGRLEEAKEVQSKALAYFQNDEIRYVLQ